MDPNYLIEVPAIGNRWAVGSVFQIHIVIVAFVIGIATVAPVAEYLGLKHKNEHWSRLAYGLSSTIVKLFSFGATWAVFALVFLFALYPRLWGTLMSLFFWMVLVIALLWLTMTLSAYFYYETWHHIERRGLHMAIGWVFVVSTSIFIIFISGMAAFQLAPNTARDFPGTLLTLTWVPQVLHRLVGNLSYAGLLLAGYAGMRLLFFPKGAVQDRAYFDWLGHVAILFGLGAAFAQPLIGGWYASTIQAASPEGFRRIMTGELSWMFLLQYFFFGAVFTLASVYLASAVRRGRPSARVLGWMRLSVLLMVAFLGLGLIPRGLPGGAMFFKYISIAAITVLAVVNLVLYVRARRDFEWGKVGRGAAGSAMAMGILTILLLSTMGFIRESARGPWLIQQQLPADAAQHYQRGSLPR